MMTAQYDYGMGIVALRVLALGAVALITLFLVNTYLTFWQGWPGVSSVLAGEASLFGGVQAGLYGAALALTIFYVVSTRTQGLRVDADRLSAFSAYIVRAAFWAVFFVGLADMVLSFLRVEDLMAGVIGEDLAGKMALSRERGLLVHYPLIAFSFFIALFVRSPGFMWLAFLVVIAEFQIVLSRFVFSYEQAFMGDLVRFWYAALFLFSSAFALIDEGHVRVDVLYAGFSRRGKAWSNALGSVLLGFPLCAVILVLGMGGKGSSIVSPLLSFETSQAGFGMYVKYLMAGFLIIFAFSMAVQFASYFLDNVADLKDEPGGRKANPDKDGQQH